MSKIDKVTRETTELLLDALIKIEDKEKRFHLYCVIYNLTKNGETAFSKKMLQSMEHKVVNT